LDLAVPEADPGISLVVGEGARGAAPERPDVRLGQEALDLLLADDVALVPLALDALRPDVVLPVLGAVLAGVLVPDDDLGQMEQIIAVRVRPNREGDLLADEVEVRVVWDLPHELAIREQEVRREKPRPHRAAQALPVRDSAGSEEHDPFLGEPV